jgi:MATE family multidrug resistance protein
MTDQNTLRRHVARTLVLAWPMILSRVGIVTMFTVDVTVLGRAAGADALAEYVLGLAINDSLVAMSIGLLIGVPVLVARETGAGNDAAAGRIWRRGLGFGVCVGLGLALALQFAESLYLATGQDPGLAARAAAVTRVVAFALPCIAAYYVSGAFLEALHRPGVSLVAILIGNVANLGLNLAFVLGLGPFPPMGAVGCALASLIVFACLALGMAVYVRLFFPERRRYGIEGGAAAVAPPFGTQARMGFASGASFLFEAGAFTVVTLIVGRLGPLALAAHGVLFQFLALTFMIAYGIAGATQVRVGNAWGRKDPRGVARAGWTGLGVAVVLTGAATAAYASFPLTFIGLFTSDVAVIAAAAPVMIWVTLATVFDGGQSVMNNACRGRGDAWFPTMLHFGSYWLVMVPLAWALTFAAGQGLAGVYQAIFIASVISLVALGRGSAGSAAKRRDLDLDLHLRPHQRRDHRRVGRADVAERGAERRADRRVVGRVGQVDHRPHHVGETEARVGQDAADRRQRVRRLRARIRGHGHGRVVVAGGAGDEAPVALHHGAAVGELGLEGGAGGDQAARHGGLPRVARPCGGTPGPATQGRGGVEPRAEDAVALAGRWTMLRRARPPLRRRRRLDGMEMRMRLLAASALALGFGAAGAALAQDDLIAEGEKVFKKCAACHQVGEGAENKVGPELADLIGRVPGSVADFKYSPAMVEFGEANGPWTEELLFTYLEDPRGQVKGTKMAFAGLKKPEEREAVIAYIVSQQVPMTN